MRVVVFGASGGCGRWLVRLALARGHRVTAVVRESSRAAVPSGARVVCGSVSDSSLLADVIRDQDVVCSCLGLRRAALLPWARLLSPPDLVESFTRRLREVVEGEPVRRIIWISGGGVGDSRSQTTPMVRMMIDAGNIGVAYRDLAAAEALMPGDDPRWLAVRPVTLTHGAPSGRATTIDRYGSLQTIRRSDVAAWMLDVADETTAHPGRTALLGTA